MANEDLVKVPEAMYRKIEQRAARLTELEKALGVAVDRVKGYKIVAVVTHPPSGEAAGEVLKAIISIVELAKGNSVAPKSHSE